MYASAKVRCLSHLILGNQLIKKINPPQPAAQKAPVSQCQYMSQVYIELLKFVAAADSGDSSSEDEAHPVSNNPKTFVDSMFTGQLAQFIVCEHCKHVRCSLQPCAAKRSSVLCVQVSVAHEPFTDLSVALAGGQGTLARYSS